MQLTRAADYAVRLVMYLAARPRGTRVNRATLAAAADAPPAFVSKVLQRLARAQLIVAHRGRVGGFELARPSDQISLLDIVTALEGPLCLNLCLLPRPACDRQPWCAAHRVWAEAQAEMARILASASVEALARSSDARRLDLGLDPLAAMGDRRHARRERRVHG